MQTTRNKHTISWKKPAGFVLSFVLFLGICGIFFSLDLWLGFLNKQTVVTAAADSQYSARAYEQLREDMEALMENHRLDPAPALALLDENEFFVASGNRITATLKGNIHQVNTSNLQWDLRDAIELQLAQSGVPGTPELDGAVDEIVFTAGNLYESHAYFQFGEAFFKARQQMLPVVRTLFFISLGLALALIILLAAFYRRRHMAFSLINYALCGSVVANLLVVGLLYVTNPIGGTGAALYYQNFIDQYITRSLVPGLGLSLIGLIVAGVLWATIRRSQKEE